MDTKGKKILLVEKHSKPVDSNRLTNTYVWKDHKERYHRKYGLPAIIAGREKTWMVKNTIHRDYDLPACIREYHKKEGIKHLPSSSFIHKKGPIEEYFTHNKRHRNGEKPAVIWYNGDFEYWVNGKLHRLGGKPACKRNLDECNIKAWYENGKPHRENDLPAIVTTYKKPIKGVIDFSKEWFIKGKRHRGNGKPALVTNKTLEWWENGKLIKKEIIKHDKTVKLFDKHFNKIAFLFFVIYSTIYLLTLFFVKGSVI